MGRCVERERFHACQVVARLSSSPPSFLAPASAAAQKSEVAGGHASAAIRREFDANSHPGFWLGTSLYVRPQLAIVGEFESPQSLEPLLRLSAHECRLVSDLLAKCGRGGPLPW
jgi:hypothetical protein